MSERYGALWGRVNSMGGADHSWTLGPAPSGNGWCFVGDSDDPESAEKALRELFAESGRILQEKEETRRKEEEAWANENIENEDEVDFVRYSGHPIKLEKFDKDGWRK